MHDDEPELAGYEPGDDSRPLRSRRMLLAMRVVVVLGLLGLVLPGILITLSTAADSATRACAMYTARDVPGALSSEARFEVFGPEGMGWSCYAERYGDRVMYVIGMGLIPAAPPRGAVPVPAERS
ncbi:hypothetical protein CLV46_0983 [Diaminobutyricimonas aerilata]|uniref:Uncharacterized protein n=1 Tax=Diaminobutyricimonas aerilata TaxID=1162967 RepID=A0A2M9CHN6_9MICO|nr:hypothetical protein [Diaminobutyricimonas aerilata]PJJ71436.1 hypothetical protein CLV46_0983 [Diaminobutyricimonas aerilata]